MRREGAKLSREEVRAQAVMRVDLRVEPEHFDGPIAWITKPWIFQGQGAWSGFLKNCRLRSLKGDGFVLVGLERVGKAWEERLVPQAWWCRLPPGAAGAPAPVPDPLALMRPNPRPSPAPAELRRLQEGNPAAG